VLGQPAAAARAQSRNRRGLAGASPCGTQPTAGMLTPKDAAADVARVLDSVRVPLIVKGRRGVPKQNDVLARVRRSARGEGTRAHTGLQEEHKTLGGAAVAGGCYGHSAGGRRALST